MRKRLAAVLAANFAAVLALLYTAGVIPVVGARTAEPMLLIAHRGDMAHHPENTIAAFVGAADIGADGIEMDVWRSSSGTWWVMHDDSVDRTTDGVGRIGDLTDDELAALRIDGGAGFEPEDANHHAVPRLADAVRAVDSFDGWLYIHLKETSREAASSLAATLVDLGVDARTTVIVPSGDSAEAVAAVAPTLRAIVLRDGLGIPQSGPGVDGWLTADSRIIRPSLVSDRPFPVEVYSPSHGDADDDPEGLLRANRFNVRAFITNDVESARRVLAGDS